MLARMGLAGMVLVLLGALAACGTGDGDGVSFSERADAPAFEVEDSEDVAVEPAAEYDMDQADSPGAAQVTGTGIERRVIRDAELVLEVSDGTEIGARSVILATGVADRYPDVQAAPLLCAGLPLDW
jgi:thioredoxin reductase